MIAPSTLVGHMGFVLTVSKITLVTAKADMSRHGITRHRSSRVATSTTAVLRLAVLVTARTKSMDISASAQVATKRLVKTTRKLARPKSVVPHLEQKMQPPHLLKLQQRKLPTRMK
jgi:hypothetical protein